MISSVSIVSRVGFHCVRVRSVVQLRLYPVEESRKVLHWRRGVQGMGRVRGTCHSKGALQRKPPEGSLSPKHPAGSLSPAVPHRVVAEFRSGGQRIGLRRQAGTCDGRARQGASCGKRKSRPTELFQSTGSKSGSVEPKVGRFGITYPCAIAPRRKEPVYGRCTEVCTPRSRAR